MMNALYITSLVAVAILVVALAVTLLTVAYLLAKTRTSLVAAAGAIGTIADRTQPIGPVLTDVNADLTAVRDALDEAAPDVPTAGRTEATAS